MTLSLTTFIGKVQKNQHPERGMRGEAVGLVNDLLCYFVEQLQIELNNINRDGHSKKTLSNVSLTAAIEGMFCGRHSEFLQSLIDDANSTVKTYQDSLERGSKKGDKKTKSAKAGISFPATRIIDHFMTGLTVYTAPKSKSKADGEKKKSKASGKTAVRRKKDEVSVFLSSIVEAIAKHIIDRAMENARNEKKVRCQIRDIKLGITGDPVLKALFHGCVIQGGVSESS
jgi:hypothetical protein